MSTTDSTEVKGWFDRFLDDGFLHEQIGRYVSSVMDITSLMFNVYFLSCLLLVSKLRVPRNIMIGYLSVCDILFAVLALAFKVIMELWFRHHLHGRYVYFYGLPFSRASQIVNMRSTPFGMAFYAVQRFILVCLPFRAASILTDRFYFVLSSALIVTSVSAIVPPMYAMHDNPAISSVFAADRSDGIRIRNQINMAINVVAAVITVIAYGPVIVRFLGCSRNAAGNAVRNDKMTDRDRNLAYSFMASTVVWLVSYAFVIDREFTFATAGYGGLLGLLATGNERADKFTAFVHYFLSFILEPLHSFINPFLFVIINRQFQQPIVSIWNVLKKCGRERLTNFVVSVK